MMPDSDRQLPVSAQDCQWWLCQRILAPFVDEFWRHAGKIEFDHDGEK